ncbi:hypothetical protein OCK74_11010 [Chitinophagaceae bacterium LB-8]|uniref:Uncharacterized protein n=1 Tax=Paraflavisolibacter caeni TaxID=2982496 RepID=A0A9X2XW96_9BACT|nr:hypothetical protein [Paraflavisolibacter caeni]MCU7549647.1 hypothetical protein [Paraflavisolibacter caeni]
MFKNNFILVIIILIIIILTLICSCRTVNAPRGSVPSRTGIENDAYGGWISAVLEDGQQPISGEFIAVSNDSLYIMCSEQVQCIVSSSVKTARIILYNTQTSSYALWTTLACIGTFANGAFAAFTFPAALATGIAATNAEANRINFYDHPRYSWQKLKKYARFPQGLPAGIRIEELKPRGK